MGKDLQVVHLLKTWSMLYFLFNEIMYVITNEKQRDFEAKSLEFKL